MLRNLSKVTEQACEMNYKDTLTPSESFAVYKALSHTLLLTEFAQDFEEDIILPIRKLRTTTHCPRSPAREIKATTQTQGLATPSPVLQALSQRRLETRMS